MKMAGFPQHTVELKLATTDKTQIPYDTNAVTLLAHNPCCLDPTHFFKRQIHNLNNVFKERYFYSEPFLQSSVDVLFKKGMM